MPRPTPYRRRLDQQDASGRLDVVVARALRESMIGMSNNPIMQTVYKAVRPEIETYIKNYFGPGTKRAKNAGRLSLEQAARIQREMRRRLAEEL